MKLLFINQFYSPHIGGSEKVAQIICEHFVSRGWDVTIATAFDKTRDFAVLNGVKIETFNLEGSFVNYTHNQHEIDRFQNFIRAWDCVDGVLVNYCAQQWGSDYSFPILSILKCKKVFMPCGFSGLYDKPFEEYFSKMPSELAKYDSIICHSKLNRDYEFCLNHKLIDKVTVIPNGIFIEEFSNVIEPPQTKFNTKFNMLYVGNYYGGKGHPELLDVLDKIRNSDVGLILIAQKEEGTWKEVESKIRAKGFDGRVHALFGISREEVIRIFHYADVFVCASKYETFPLVILEAMASELPWVALETAGNVAELSGGIIAKDTIEMAETIKKLKKESTKALGIEGRKQVEEQFSWKSILKKYENTFSIQIVETMSMSNGEILIRENGELKPINDPHQMLDRYLETREKKYFSALITCLLDDKIKIVNDKKYNRIIPLKPIATLPFVTVLLPVYNSKLLNYTLESLLLQTYRNFEVLIINDGSTCSRTKEILAHYLGKYSNFIRVKDTPQNMGIAKALNFGLSQITDKTVYIARQDSGDASKPGRLKRQVDFLESHEDVSLCSSLSDTIDMNGNVLPIDSYMQTLDFAGKSREEIIVWFLTDNHIVHGSVMIRKKSFDKIGGKYSEKDLHAEDYELWLRMLYNEFRFHCIPEILYQWRSDPSGICRSNSNLQTLSANIIRQKYRELFLKRSIK